ncbi:hypothetical protein K435DRAFT_873358 [Dendrothele bispora CBS 962.96]|uniref:Uncharacterized protein n=1 Tax=Dendrothele bispora (strain CBS 962.96) TaxID=1314807 RepID=A0A4S8KZD3_DENBC|nr:hypothetical protein K435DRAFT_873358 [Dendrothele bispora CBS 962.96]
MLIVDSHNVAGFAIDYIAVHLYVNSLLASLNARNHIRGNAVGSYTTSWEANPRSTRVNFLGNSSSIEHSQPPLNASVVSGSGNVQNFREPLQKGELVGMETETYPLSNLDCQFNSHTV